MISVERYTVRVVLAASIETFEAERAHIVATLAAALSVPPGAIVLELLGSSITVVISVVVASRGEALMSGPSDPLTNMTVLEDILGFPIESLTPPNITVQTVDNGSPTALAAVEASMMLANPGEQAADSGADGGVVFLVLFLIAAALGAAYHALRYQKRRQLPMEVLLNRPHLLQLTPSMRGHSNVQRNSEQVKEPPEEDGAYDERPLDGLELEHVDADEGEQDESQTGRGVEDETEDKRGDEAKGEMGEGSDSSSEGTGAGPDARAGDADAATASDTANDASSKDMVQV